MFRVVRMSAIPSPSTRTWFKAKAMPPRLWQLPIWMCDTWTEFACSPVIFSSMVVERWPAETEIVPVAFAVLTGSSLKEKALALGEGEWPGDVAWVGEGVGPDPAPQAATHIAIAVIFFFFKGHVNPGFLPFSPTPRPSN